MIIIQKNVKLADYTTFRVGGVAKYFAVVRNKSELLEVLNWARLKKQKIFILGGGSNSLFSDRGFKGLVIKNEIKGLRVIKETNDHVWVEADSGEWWSTLVDFCVTHKYYGAENLFLIPGTVGAAPMQNIGAYGVELKDIFSSLTAIDWRTMKEKKFSTKDCQFGYRQSVFKKRLKNKYFIHSVTIKLNKRPCFKIDYGDIKEKLSKNDFSARDLVKVIMEIRNSKLPNPAILPNAGSFFKNPEVLKAKFIRLQKKFPDIKFFTMNGRVKIPAGWLIEKCGFKGQKLGPVGVYEKQALILVNHGGAKTKDVIKLATKIQRQVKKTFGLDLEREVVVVD